MTQATYKNDHAEMIEKIKEAFPVSPTNGDTKPIVFALIEWGFSDETYTLEQVCEWQFETISCAGCHAPCGLIYNEDIAAKFADWWDDIDDALDSWRDATGESYAPKTCGELVWFAVEWYANEIANFMRYEMKSE